MKKLFFIIILNIASLILNSFCFAQNRDIDSLLTLLRKDKPDTSKVKHLNALGWLLMNQNPDTAIILGNQALSIITPFPTSEFSSAIEGIEGKPLKFLRAKTLSQLGAYYRFKSDYHHALDYHLKALIIYQELKNKKKIAVSLGNIGIVYDEQGDYPKAMDYYFKALEMEENLGDKNGISRHLCNIGIVYDEQGNYPKALNYYFKALKIAEQMGDKEQQANNLDNIGGVYYKQGNFSKAFESCFKALKIYEELGNKKRIAANFDNIGIISSAQKDYPKAFFYYFKALKMAEGLGDKYELVILHGNIGSLYITTGQFKEAEQFLNSAIAIADSIGAKNYLMISEESLSKLYDTMGQYKQAFIHYKKATGIKDTLFSQENKKELIRKEMNYEFDKKEAATKAAHDKEIAVAEAEKKKQQFILFLVSSFLILVFLFAGFIFRSLKITSRQKNIIELQKNEVSQQKEMVEKQKEKIVGSITYARRIQQSILMEVSEIQNYLPECFIYFQPKDIVSGDFYWCSKIDDKIILAAVDCTGHGVPGAFMSMIGNTLLNQIVNEKHITKPSEILLQLNLGVYDALHQKKEETLSDDGMDIALCVIDYKNNELQYAGAQNPLYILFGNQIDIIKADIHGIGGGGMIARIHDPVKKEFTNHVIPIKKGMSIYLFSDGYSDQFGGDRRKKFGTQKFKELLLSIKHLSMQKQKENLVSAHEEWKGSTAQIDDILVMGVRI